MNKLIVSIWKEFLLLLSDKVGLLLMYLMPILLVFVITIVQDSTFKLVNENKIDILIVNHDTGNLSDSLIQMMNSSGTFNIEQSNDFKPDQIQSELLNSKALIAIEIPKDFSDYLKQKSKSISTKMLAEFGLTENSKDTLIATNKIHFYYDPVLQENFRFSIVNSIYSLIGIIENKQMLTSLYAEMGFDQIPDNFERNLSENRIEIIQKSAASSTDSVIPNSTQHNVPAWSIFAMFFMVVSLGGNIVKERLSGSFTRLMTIPSSFGYTLLSKMLVYLFVAITQLIIIFIIGKFIFPLIGLPSLTMPQNIIGLILISILSAMAAISFSLLIGTHAKTQEQANGFGAITVIILAAIGGIWVPSFVMPGYLQAIGKISPLHWCLEGYYVLFLKGGEWNLLFPSLLFLILFILACQILTYIRLKFQNYI